VALTALASGPAAGQNRSREAGIRTLAYSGLLTIDRVQKELQLDTKQIVTAKVLSDKINVEWTQRLARLRGLNVQALQHAVDQLGRDLNKSAIKEAGDFLQPGQLARLKQIGYQVWDLQTFMDPEVASRLKLSDAQKSDILAVRQQSLREARRLVQSTGNDPEARARLAKKHRERARDNFMALLDDEQRKTWKELLGAPFDVDSLAN
jgi:hypothetical protein